MATTTGERQILQETQEEKDLGVVMSNNLKFCDQATHAANKASRALGILKRTFRTWKKEIFLTLYPTFVRPHLEYTASVWSPYKKKDIAILEKIQRKDTT